MLVSQHGDIELLVQHIPQPPGLQVGVHLGGFRRAASLGLGRNDNHCSCSIIVGLFICF